MRDIFAGSTNQSIDIFIMDTTSTTGQGLTGLVYNSPGLNIYYRRGANGVCTQIPLVALANAQAAWTSGGFVEISATLDKGGYRLDLPNAVVASGVDFVTIYVYGATNAAPVPIMIELLGYNPYAVPASLADFFTSNTGKVYTDAVTGSVVKEMGVPIVAKTNLIPATPAAVGSAMTLDPAERTAVANAHLDLTSGVEPSLTPRQTLRLIAAMAGAKTDGFTPGSAGIGHVRNIGDNKNRMTFNYDANGNITAVTLDLT